MDLIKLFEIIGLKRCLVLVIAMLFTAGSATLDAMLVVTAIPLASEFLQRNEAQGAGFGQLSIASPLTLALLALVGKNLLQIASAYLVKRVGFSVITDGTTRVFQNILKQSTKTASSAGEQQASVITEPVHLVLNVINPLISLVACVLTIGIILLTITFVISPSLLPLIGIFAAIFIIYSVYTRIVLRKSGEVRRLAEAERTGFTRSALKANGETGFSSWTSGVVDVFLRKPTKAVEEAMAGKWYYTETYKNVLELTVIISTVLFFLIFERQQSTTLVPEFAALAVAAVRIAPAVNRLMINFQTLQFGLPSFHVLRSLWSSPDVGSGFGRYEATYTNGQSPGFDLRMRGSGELVGHLDLRPGLYSLTGESGIGKTSLLLQIAESIRDRNLGYLAFVSQDVLILPARLHANIYVAPERVSFDPSVEHAVLSLADAHDSILSQSRVLNDDESIVDAVSLSGGQARRLAIMRALASNPDVLMADEPTAGLHSEMSSVLIDALKSLAVKRPVIVATHDANLVAASTGVIEL